MDLTRALEAIGAGQVSVMTGDLGIAFALLDALPMPAHRRHRPQPPPSGAGAAFGCVGGC